MKGVVELPHCQKQHSSFHILSPDDTNQEALSDPTQSFR